MNRPKRPPFTPARKKKPTPARSPVTTGPPRRRSPLDYIPANIEPRFKVLGTGADRQALLTYATPMEMLVVHGFTREIDDAFHRYSGRLEEFWNNNPDSLSLARKLDDVLAGVVARRSAA
jgi:hypothetical protein